jgi:DNA-binding protein HU-beta
MNRSQLVDDIAKRTSLGKADASEILATVLEAIQGALQRGEEVSITGFGKFHVVERPARGGRNPRTGESIKIKASRTPRFSAGATLRQAVAKRPSARRTSKSA